MKRHARPSLLLAACALTLAASLSGCGSTDPSPESTQAGEGPGASKVEAPAVGDCRVDAASGLPADAEVVPCSQQHDEQVFHAIEMSDDAFSVEAVDAATTECVGDAFTAFVGVPREQSALSVYLIPPTEETWDQPGGRTLYCVLLDPAGPVEGTFEGVAR